MDEAVVKKALFLLSMFSIAIFILIIIFIILESIPAFHHVGIFNILLGINWAPDNGSYGILPMILGSVVVTVIALLIAVPLSIGCAIFIEEFSPNNVKKLFKPLIQTLAGIPSVVYGFFGLTVLVPISRAIFGGSGFSILVASIVLAIMILPTIISLSQDAINSVPSEYIESSLALGSTHVQTIKNIILPNACLKITTAVILAMGRAIGETLAIIMVAGNVANIPTSILNPVRTLTSNIALEMGYAMDIHYNSLFATAIVLFGIIMILMIISNVIEHKGGC